MIAKREPTYSIGDTAKMTGVSQKQLRHWEGKYIPEPERVVCGERSYRWYTKSQVNLIRRIKDYLDEGFTLPTAAKKGDEDMSRKGRHEDA